MNMTIRACAKWTGIVFLLLALGACGGSGEGGTGGGGGPPPAATTIGAAGGTINGPNGAKLVIPPGALATDTAIAIEQTSAGSPALPGSFSAAGGMFAFTPHGTTFAAPVTVTLPFDPASVPAGQVPALFKTNAQNQWEQVAGATFGAATVTARVSSFSWVQVGALLRNDPVRLSEFLGYGPNGAPPVLLHEVTHLPGDGQGGEETRLGYGPAILDPALVGFSDTHPSDGQANGHIFTSADGVTYGVFAEAPLNLPPDDSGFASKVVNGSGSRFTQTQSYIMLEDKATLTFTVTGALIQVADFKPQGPPGPRVGTVRLEVGAFKTPPPPPGTTDTPVPDYFFLTIGRAELREFDGSWIKKIGLDGGSRLALWSDEPGQEDFEFGLEPVTFGACLGHQGYLKFKRRQTYSVDLSSLKKGDEFTLEVVAFASATNRGPQGPASDCEGSAVNAFLRDPLGVGGPTLAFTGLAPTNRPLPAPPVQVLIQPASCVPGPGPSADAGVLQFDAASYTVDEFADASPTITVTRTGGSKGAVTATFTTSNGTAIGGTDYTPVNATVFFADGDTGQRIVTVPIIPNGIDEIDKTVNLTLSQPGGCAALGVQTSAVLTIRDDDLRSALPSGLDPTFGIGGKATLERFGGDRSGMALQADGKIVMVGGTFTDFVLARFNADGSLDTGFGVEGKVTTDMGSGLRQEEALGVAIQSDGKIVVVGHTAIPNTPPAPALPPTFALARYLPDGNLDTSFGTGGKVSGNVNGQAYAVAIQSDGKIVVAGEFSFSSTSGSDFSDVTIARFNANGSLDASFGASGTGQIVTDIGLSTNTARNIVLQPNGTIVVSGKPPGSQAGFDHTDMVRYQPNGSLDTSFGSGGKLTFAGADVGQGLARQPDGKLVLLGSVIETTAPATARFVLKRLNANGSPDTTFGNAGTVDSAFTESATANAVALQGDGKIVAVGTRAFTVNLNFVVARYNADGSVDRGFGSDGNMSIDFFGFPDAGENVLVQPDGKIVVGGLARNDVDGYGLARINP